MRIELDTNPPAKIQPGPPEYWALDNEVVLMTMSASQNGLTTSQAAKRMRAFGPNALGKTSTYLAINTLLRQFRSPLVLILVAAATISASVGEVHEAIIISIIVLASSLLGFLQEHGASKAVEKLKQRLSQTTTVVRDGADCVINASQVVPGDVLRLSAGKLIPADGVILSSLDFNVSEASLTGEAFPVVKGPGKSALDAMLAQRNNVVFAGTSVRSGTASVLVVKTGATTEFAAIAATLERKLPETEFARGIRRFGVLMTVHRLQKQDVDGYFAGLCRAGSATPGDSNILQKVLADFRGIGEEIEEQDLRVVMHEMMFDAAEQLENESSSGKTHKQQDDYLQEALEETFPASDPIAPGHPQNHRKPLA